jgi:copper chaperone
VGLGLTTRNTRARGRVVLEVVPPGGMKIGRWTMTVKTEYLVTGMHCGHCEHAVRSEVSQIAGVTGVDVSASTGFLTVESAAELADADVFAAVDEAGYEAARI